MKKLIWLKPDGLAVVSHAVDGVDAVHLRESGAVEATWQLVCDDYRGEIPAAHALLWDAKQGAVVPDGEAVARAAWSVLQAQAQSALDASDITMIRCVEHGVAVPAEWATYRAALRAIVRATSGDPTQPLPARPAYPAGT